MWPNQQNVKSKIRGRGTRSHNIKTAFGLARDFALRSPLAVLRSVAPIKMGQFNDDYIGCKNNVGNKLFDAV